MQNKEYGHTAWNSIHGIDSILSDIKFMYYAILHSINYCYSFRLVLYSKYRAFMEGVHKLASFQRKNLFKVHFVCV